MLKKSKKVMGVQRLATPGAKKELLSNMKNNTIKIMRLLAASKEDTESKEDLANMFLFILNIIDIEGERISFDAIKAKKQSKPRRMLKKD